MNRLKAAGFGFLGGAAVMVALALGLTATQVSAQDETVRIGSGTAAPGGQASVTLEALNMAAPGLGAWTIDIVYDPTVVTAVACNPQSGSVCNRAYDAETVRVTGASADGLEGDASLAGILFECREAEGTSALTLVLSVLADATPGVLHDIKEITATENGSITCSAGAGGGEGIIRVESATAAPGQEVSVLLEALDIGAPGLGAWTIDITYDPAVLTAVACVPQQGAAPVCNPAFDEDTVRATGADPNGLEGDSALAEITFQCAAEGSSTLALAVQVLVDATVGNPQVIAATAEGGSIICAVAAPTVPPGATATPGAPTPTPGAALPVAGTGDISGPGGTGPVGWFIAGLIGAGIAWLIAGLAGAGLATATASSGAGPRALERRGEATFIPTFRPLRVDARQPLRHTVVNAQTGPASPPEAGAGRAPADGERATSWLSAAREELARAGLSGIAGFRPARRRERRS